jgi:hypothetical protein
VPSGDGHQGYLGELGVMGADDERPDGAIIVNDTGLEDLEVVQAVKDLFVEHASLAGLADSNFQVYANQEGSLLARRAYQAPTNVFEEIELARDIAERDDDVAATLGQILATAYRDGMQHHHEDEKTIALFNELAKNMNEDRVLRDMLREYMIASSVTTLSIFTRESFRFSPEGVDRMVNQDVSAPLVGVLPAEEIRVVGNDIFGTAPVAYKPKSAKMQSYLRELFDERTTPAKRAALRAKDPVTAAMVLGRVEIETDRPNALERMEEAWLLNPRMVHRSTAPKGAWAYPRPRLTRNFALLEAKRLLNIMDFALLQGGSNYIVVAKKGTDQKPATPNEVRNLGNVVKKASRTGVIVGDHRLEIEIITPEPGGAAQPGEARARRPAPVDGDAQRPAARRPEPGWRGPEGGVGVHRQHRHRGPERRAPAHGEPHLRRGRAPQPARVPEGLRLDLARQDPPPGTRRRSPTWCSSSTTEATFRVAGRSRPAATTTTPPSSSASARRRAATIVSSPRRPVPFNKQPGQTGANPASQPQPANAPADSSGGRPRGTGPTTAGRRALAFRGGRGLVG